MSEPEPRGVIRAATPDEVVEIRAWLRGRPSSLVDQPTKPAPKERTDA